MFPRSVTIFPFFPLLIWPPFCLSGPTSPQTHGYSPLSQGYAIQFDAVPYPTPVLPTAPPHLLEEVSSLLQKEAIETSLDAIIPLLQLNDCFVVIDLQNAYFHITIRDTSCRFLHFTIGDTTYQFKSLLFSLSTAPIVFTTYMALVVTYLHLRGITIFSYLDDWSLIAPSWAQALEDSSFTLSLLRTRGLQINLDKSLLTPSHTVPYIGALLDSTVARAFLPTDRHAKLAQLIRLFQPHMWGTAHKAQQLLGLMASTTAMVQHARLKMCVLQAWFLTYFNPLRDHPHQLLKVSSELSTQLTWWTTPENLQIGNPFHTLDLSVQVTMNGSSMGWGAHCKNLQIHRHCLPSERHLHINQLELLTVIKAF